MKRISALLLGVILLAGAAASHVYAQSFTGRALFAFKDGATPEQETEDRKECHDWAVTQTGFDPTAIYEGQLAGIRTSSILEVGRKMDVASGFQDPRWGSGVLAGVRSPGGIGGARTTSDRRRLAEVYDKYLLAGQTCLEGKGYTVTRKPHEG